MHWKAWGQLVHMGWADELMSWSSDAGGASTADAPRKWSPSAAGPMGRPLHVSLRMAVLRLSRPESNKRWYHSRQTDVGMLLRPGCAAGSHFVILRSFTVVDVHGSLQTDLEIASSAR